MSVAEQQPVEEVVPPELLVYRISYPLMFTLLNIIYVLFFYNAQYNHHLLQQLHQ